MKMKFVPALPFLPAWLSWLPQLQMVNAHYFIMFLNKLK